MSIFRKTTKRSAAREELTGQIAKNIFTHQRRLADYLNPKIRKLSVKGILLLLILLFALAGSYCLYLIFHHLKSIY